MNPLGLRTEIKNVWQEIAKQENKSVKNVKLELVNKWLNEPRGIDFNKKHILSLKEIKLKCGSSELIIGRLLFEVMLRLNNEVNSDSIIEPKFADKKLTLDNYLDGSQGLKSFRDKLLGNEGESAAQSQQINESHLFTDDEIAALRDFLIHLVTHRDIEASDERGVLSRWFGPVLTRSSQIILNRLNQDIKAAKVNAGKQEGIVRRSTLREAPHRIQTLISNQSLVNFNPKTKGSAEEVENEFKVILTKEIDKASSSSQDLKNDSQQNLISETIDEQEITATYQEVKDTRQQIFGERFDNRIFGERVDNDENLNDQSGAMSDENVGFSPDIVQDSQQYLTINSIGDQEKEANLKSEIEQLNKELIDSLQEIDLNNFLDVEQKENAESMNSNANYISIKLSFLQLVTNKKISILDYDPIIKLRYCINYVTENKQNTDYQNELKSLLKEIFWSSKEEDLFRAINLLIFFGDEYVGSNIASDLFKCINVLQDNSLRKEIYSTIEKALEFYNYANLPYANGKLDYLTSRAEFLSKYPVDKIDNEALETNTKILKLADFVRLQRKFKFQDFEPKSISMSNFVNKEGRKTQRQQLKDKLILPIKKNLEVLLTTLSHKEENEAKRNAVAAAVNILKVAEDVIRYYNSEMSYLESVSFKTLRLVPILLGYGLAKEIGDNVSTIFELNIELEAENDFFRYIIFNILKVFSSLLTPNSPLNFRFLLSLESEVNKALNKQILQNSVITEKRLAPETESQLFSLLLSQYYTPYNRPTLETYYYLLPFFSIDQLESYNFYNGKIDACLKILCGHINISNNIYTDIFNILPFIDNLTFKQFSDFINPASSLSQENG